MLTNWLSSSLKESVSQNLAWWLQQTPPVKGLEASGKHLFDEEERGLLIQIDSNRFLFKNDVKFPQKLTQMLRENISCLITYHEK